MPSLQSSKKLNNGHLEQAITVNLGPGDIYGRWGENIKKKRIFL